MNTITSIHKSESATCPVWLETGEAGYANVDGVGLRYVKAGSGAPLVLIHTIRTQLDYFRRIIPELARHFTVYALDLPGHGHSDIPETEYTEAFFTKFVEGFLDSLDIRHATLAGESIGAVIALSLAAKHNPRVKNVVALNPYDYGKSGGIRRSSALGWLVFTAMQWPFIGWVIARSENKLILRWILRGGFHNPEVLPEDLLNEFNRVGFRKGYRAAERSTFMNWQSWIAARNGYGDIAVPVTLVYAEHDWSLPEERRANQEAIANAQPLELKNTGHFSSLEKPGEVTRIILQASAQSVLKPAVEE